MQLIGQITTSSDLDFNRPARTDNYCQFHTMSDCFQAKWPKFRLNRESLSRERRTKGTYAMQPVLAELFASRLDMIRRADQ